MCGIVGYIGYRDAFPIVLKGLKRLEYRGYDSAGLALVDDGNLNVYKKQGKVAALEEYSYGKNVKGHIGIGHTRWATHGEPSDRNSHPHLSNSGKIAIIHNGIIENYAQLKQDLISKGYVFHSDTDTEVLVNFIEDIYLNLPNGTLEEALRMAMKRVVGAYCVLMIRAEEPEVIYAARKGSPLVIGIGKGEHFLASDATPIIEYTREVVYVNDYEIAIVKPDELILKNLGNERQDPYITKLDMQLGAIEKEGYDHFMLKEIFEQPNSVYDCLRGRLNIEDNTITLSGIAAYEKQILAANRIIILACGTSWHAGLVAEYIIEETCRIPVEVEYASEFRYRNPIVHEGDIIIAISQSGETADTIVAIEQARKNGAIILGIVNAVGSSISRISDAGVYTHSGPEIGVASTKAFTGQLTVLILAALKLGLENGTLTQERFVHLCHELAAVPDKIKKILESTPTIQKIAEKYANCQDVLFLGRGYNFPIALEGALKLKEISYIHAEGYPAAEMKHGPIALVDEKLLSVFIATKDPFFEKVVSNMQEIKARKGMVLAVVSEGSNVPSNITDDIIVVPETDELIAPLLNVVPLQLLSYYIGVAKGFDVDKPRNLAKSVTVE